MITDFEENGVPTSVVLFLKCIAGFALGSFMGIVLYFAMPYLFMLGAFYVLFKFLEFFIPTRADERYEMRKAHLRVARDINNVPT